MRTPSQEVSRLTRGSCRGEESLTGLLINAKGASTRNISEAQVTYFQVRFTIKDGLHLFFNTISCGLLSREAYNRVNTVKCVLYPK